MGIISTQASRATYGLALQQTCALLKHRFPNLTVEETLSLAREIVEVVLSVVDMQRAD